MRGKCPRDRFLLQVRWNRILVANISMQFVIQGVLGTVVTVSVSLPSPGDRKSAGVAPLRVILDQDAGVFSGCCAG